MSLLKPAQATNAYLKMGMMGFQGSGKTYTATQIAIGLVKLMQAKKLNGTKPIAFIDTEKGSDWALPIVEKAGLQLVTAKTRAFSDLLQIVPEAQKSASFLIIDSVTHFWTEFCDAYAATRARQMKRDSYRLQFQDWAYLKKEWRRFTDLFVNSPLHMIICGRAGFEYDYFEDEAGKKQLEKTGIKFKAEGEMGYEPDLLVLMERRMNLETKADEHIAHVVKDRSTLLDGKEIADPTFDFFLPHIKCLNLGGEHVGIDTTRNSEAMIPSDKKDWNPIQREIVLDEIGDLLTLHVPGMGAADKKRKVELLRKYFNASWAEIEKVMPLFELRAGYDGMHRELEGKPSRYAAQPQAEATNENEPIDEIPDQALPPPKPKAKPAAAKANVEELPAAPQVNPDYSARLKRMWTSAIPENKTLHDCAHFETEFKKIAHSLTASDRAEVEKAFTAHRNSLLIEQDLPLTAAG